MRRTVPAIRGGVGVGVERALGECHRLPHKDFSDLYEKMSAEGESASETHLHPVRAKQSAERRERRTKT